MNTVLRYLATAAGVAAILARWAAESLADLDVALSLFTAAVPDFVPDVVDDGSAI